MTKNGEPSRLGGTIQQFNAEDAAWIKRACAMVQAFRDVNPDITANQILAYLLIAEKPGITQPDLNKALKLSPGGIPRIVAVLSDRGNRGTPGLELVDIVPVPSDYRQRAQVLTKKGRELLGKLRSISRSAK